MKKTLLLASAAVLFAGSASAMDNMGLELGIEGYASVYGVYAKQSLDSTNPNNEFGLKKEIEIDVTGEVTLENGLTVGVTTELQQNDSSENESAAVQESYIYAEGSFGKVIVGQEYNAAYLMQVAAPAVDAELDGMDPTYNVVTGNGVADQSYDMSFQTDDDMPIGDKVTYISPIWEGLQIGASYTPQDDEVSDVNGNSTSGEEAYAVAARYATEIAGADVTIGTGWNQQDGGGSTAVDAEQWNVGVTAEINAWTIGAAYFDEQKTDRDDITATVAGVNYETGPFNYGVSYMHKVFDSNGSNNLDDRLDRYMAGVNYTYGPGMTLNGSVSYNSYEAGDNNPTTENDATVVAVGTVINF